MSFPKWAFLKILVFWLILESHLWGSFDTSILNISINSIKPVPKLCEKIGENFLINRMPKGLGLFKKVTCETTKSPKSFSINLVETSENLSISITFMNNLIFQEDYVEKFTLSHIEDIDDFAHNIAMLVHEFLPVSGILETGKTTPNNDHKIWLDKFGKRKVKRVQLQEIKIQSMNLLQTKYLGTTTLNKLENQSQENLLQQVIYILMEKNPKHIDQVEQDILDNLTTISEPPTKKTGNFSDWIPTLDLGFKYNSSKSISKDKIFASGYTHKDREVNFGIPVRKLSTKLPVSIFARTVDGPNANSQMIKGKLAHNYIQSKEYGLFLPLEIPATRQEDISLSLNLSFYNSTNKIDVYLPESADAGFPANSIGANGFQGWLEFEMAYGKFYGWVKHASQMSSEKNFTFSLTQLGAGLSFFTPKISHLRRFEFDCKSYIETIQASRKLAPSDEYLIEAAPNKVGGNVSYLHQIIIGSMYVEMGVSILWED